jgi:hypothetical protein
MQNGLRQLFVGSFLMISDDPNQDIKLYWKDVVILRVWQDDQPQVQG